LTNGTEIGTINPNMSSIPTTISASQARNNFYALLEEVAKKLKRITITHRGEAQAVVMHPDEVASWEETMDILADKKLVAQILRGESEIKAGKAISEEKLLKELNIPPEELEEE